MTEITPVLTKLYQLAALSPTKEVCGVVDSTFVVHPISNRASNQKSCFVFDKREYFTLIKELKEKGQHVLFIYHSHPSNNVTPSSADLAFTKRSGIPQLIIGKNTYRVVENA